jgi:acetoacetyl-CoA synthetase
MSKAVYLPSPTGAMVDQLIGIWTRTLQPTGPILPDTNFFELGGDSLLAVNLFLEIERTTGHQLPITTIYDAPTIAELAELMVEGASAKFSPLVLLNDGGSGPPLFIVHGVGGTVVEFATLGRLIRSDGPVYAIQARGIDGEEAPLRTIEEMADYYVAAVREIQPWGPYRLAGYSFGGMVAIEMGRRLGAENIEHLLLLDAFAHPQTWPLLSRLQVRAAKLVRQVASKARQSPRKMFRDVLAKACGAIVNRRRKQSVAERASEVRDWLGTVNPDLPAPLRETRIAGSAALLAYRPKYYPGEVTFLRAGTIGDTFPVFARNVWQHLVREMTVQTIPGSHRSIVAEQAASTAEALSGLLEPKVAVAREYIFAAPAADSGWQVQL